MSEAAAPALAAPSGDLRRRRLAIGAVGLGLTLLAVSVTWLGRVSSPLPVFAELPPFQLVSEQGHPFGTDELRGHPYVADFIYTGCHESCPRLTAEMVELQSLLAGDPNAVRLVSFSVDPVHDTPEQLLKYATAAGAVPGRWVFLTGPLEKMTALLEQGFKIATLDGAMHDNHFVVVDGRGRVRGYFAGDADGRRAIRSALKRLLWGE